MSRKKANNKWFNPSKAMDWHKTQSETIRRRNALAAHKGNNLATARALGALANVTQDIETRRKARQDSSYFYQRYKRLKR